MGTLWQDIRYGLRMLARSPGFTVVVVLILAVGIGANTALFSVVHGVLLRPLPFQDPGHVVQVLTQQRQDRRPDPLNNLQDGVEIQKRNHVFAASAPIDLQLLLDAGGDEPRYLGGARVPACFFDLLGVRPALGRGFRPEEEQPGQDRVAVLSHEYWTQRYGGNPDIIGQSLVLQEAVYTREGILFQEMACTVIGVMPAGFWCLDHRDLWTPLVLSSGETAARIAGQSGYLIGRLRPGIQLGQAQAEVDVIGDQLVRERPQAGKDRRFVLVLPRERLVADVQRTLWVLLGTVGFVLLIACANVTNMMLARALGRQREMAVRAALGAGRLRLVRQSLTESLLLSLLGGLGGLLLAICSFDVIKALLPSNMPRVSEIRIDGGVLGFTLFASLLAGTLIGLAPILRLAQMSAGRTLKEAGSAVRGGISRSVLHQALLVSEIGLSLMLLIGAGLMIRSLRRFTSIDLGFDARNVLVANVDPSESIYAQPQPYFQALLERVRQLPGVQTAALGDLRLFGSSSDNSFSIPGRDTPRGERGPSAVVIHISEDYFRALRIPLWQGRFFVESDRTETEPVVVVNQAFAGRYFTDASVLGQTIVCWNKAWRIVGVVADVRPNGLRADAGPTMYFPYRQMARPNARLIVRTEGEPLSVLKPLRHEILALTPNRPAPRIRTIDEMLGGQTAPMRFTVRLLSLFAALALLLAAVGVYGLMAFFVSQRTQEIGIRMALGARSVDIGKAVLRQSLRLTSVGLALGLAGALAATRIIRSLLYEVSPTDPLTFVCVGVLLAGVALLASYLPARRAARVDPMVALRYE
jgi:putative ABC transport system permease protein